MDDLVNANFYCLYAVADGNQRIQITEKMLEFSSTVLSKLSLYLETEAILIKLNKKKTITAVKYIR